MWGLRRMQEEWKSWHLSHLPVKKVLFVLFCILLAHTHTFTIINRKHLLRGALPAEQSVHVNYVVWCVHNFYQHYCSCLFRHIRSFHECNEVMMKDLFFHLDLDFYSDLHESFQVEKSSFQNIMISFQLHYSCRYLSLERNFKSQISTFKECFVYFSQECKERRTPTILGKIHLTFLII